jgi:hypothetical protein
MKGTLSDPSSGQPNGRIPQSVVPPGLPYGQGGALRAAVAATPVPPGASGLSSRQKAAVALHRAGMLSPEGRIQHPGVIPLSAPTENPTEPVTAGAPLDPGPTNPMAQAGAMGAEPSLAGILAAAAQATGSPTLRALAERADAIGQ